MTRDIRFRNPLELSAFVSEKVRESGEKFYLFVDEIQLSDAVKNPYNPEGKRITFYDALNDFREFENLDVYVTGSNSKMLSSDILTEFRGRSDEIRVHPLSFSEFFSVYDGEKRKRSRNTLSMGAFPLCCPGRMMPPKWSICPHFLPKFTKDNCPGRDIKKRWYDENGVLNIAVTDFLLDEDVI